MTTPGIPLSAVEGAALLGRPQQIRRAPARPINTTFRTSADVHEEVGARFRQDTANHELTVLHEQGLYRHLRLRSPRSSEYWFDVVTWPGSLAIRGDVGEDYVFSRVEDMFTFFRGKGINPHYWAEKLGGGQRSVKEYSADLARQLVVEHFVDAVRFGDAPRGLGKAIRAEVLNEDLFDDREAREAIESFSYKGFEFGDVWEWDLHDYDRGFLWCCHAIVWAISRYDAARTAVAA